MHGLWVLLAAAALLASQRAPAETRYVTDVLRLELTAEPEDASDSLSLLTSGAQLEVLETRRYYARVQTLDGQVGWVKSGYLTEEKPAQARLQELERERAALAAQLQSLQENLSSQAEQLSTVEATRDAAQRSALQNESELATLRSENVKLTDQASRFRFSVPLKWLLTISAAALLGGFVAGLLWLDWRRRLRHGGFRL